MGDMIALSVLVLGAIGVVSATLLYVVSKRFHVHEDSRIAEVGALLPGANCGGCGYNGCHDFASACCKATSLDGLHCPGAGNEGMAKIANLLGLTAAVTEAKVAVLKCNGTCQARPQRAVYDGASSCAVANLTGSGPTACAAGCLGLGDCVSACRFGALSIDTETGLPVIDREKCTACGLCVKACPRLLLELRRKGPRGMRVWVACNNRQRGVPARKACENACIACSKCLKECTHDAIVVADNLSVIDPAKCKLCRKCVNVCPTGAILTANFPVKKLEKAAEA